MTVEFDVPEPVVPEFAAGYEAAEARDFEVADLYSCFYYLAEMTYGFTCSQLSWTPEWPRRYYREMVKFHGARAARAISTMVEIHGLYGYALSDDSMPVTSKDLLKLATYYSEVHRGLRDDCGNFVS